MNRQRIFLENPTEGKAARSWAELPAVIRGRLALEGIHRARDWLALSPARRRAIFGITRSIRRMVDRAATQERRP